MTSSHHPRALLLLAVVLITALAHLCVQPAHGEAATASAGHHAPGEHDSPAEHTGVHGASCAAVRVAAPATAPVPIASSPVPALVRTVTTVGTLATALPPTVASPPLFTPRC